MQLIMTSFNAGKLCSFQFYALLLFVVVVEYYRVQFNDDTEFSATQSLQ